MTARAAFWLTVIALAIGLTLGYVAQLYWPGEPFIRVEEGQ